MIVNTLCGKYNIKKGKITAACDGLNTIRMDMDRYIYFYYKFNNFSMLSEINSKIQKSPIQWNWRHVKGHQENYFGPLNRWATVLLKRLATFMPNMLI